MHPGLSRVAAPLAGSPGGKGSPVSPGRLRVLRVGYVLAPCGAGSVVAVLGHCQVCEQPIRGSAVPMLHIRWNDDCIAGVQYLRLLALEADAPHPGQAVERLPNRM